MLIRDNIKTKKLIAVFFAAMYVLVVLFSSDLHNHKGESFFNNLGSKKTQKTISKQHVGNPPGDCLACHFLVAGNSLVPDQFNFHFEKHTQETEQIVSAQEKIWEQIKFSFQLRGPPYFI